MKNVYFRSFTFLLLAILLVYPLHSVQVKAAVLTPLDMYFPTDIDEHWAYYELDNFVNADLLRGYVDLEGNVTVKPNHSISRAEFVSILVRALGLTSEAPGKTFTDVEMGKWYSEPIRVASSLGIVGGISETKFGPNQLIKRGEIAAMVVRAFSSSVQFEGEMKPFSDVPEYYAKPSILKASQAGIVRGASETEFKPFANAKRAEAVVMLQRALDLQNSALPDDSLLTTAVLDSEEKENQVIKDKTYDQFDDVYAQFYTGYYFALSHSASEELIALVTQGYEIEIEKISAQTLTVLEKTDRFAVIESSGGSFKTTITKDNEQTEEKVATDGIYYLKKMPDESWKIYMYYEDEQQ
ncbi:S-layer homology domain-containing protein [Paenibacillus alkaliterrae]|uniref:S-layer homology domain-containing protein n=1 Tax=Paenibacillus alkaliterrae TaxID=320909 RepID=UPI001F240842|nr:S-layer homology domain-containing protein [Paenibacillus alkaliterrae]MCF2938641.1 S-layer homology domain-containing protein [Paenibacillus alkaliterrae]